MAKYMKKYVAEVYTRTSALKNEWKRRPKDLVIYARNIDSAYNKLDQIGRRMCSDYTMVKGELTEVEED